MRAELTRAPALLTAVAVAALLCACSKNPEPAAAPAEPASAAASAASAAPTAMAQASAHDGINWVKAKTEADVDGAFEQAKASGKPLFLYWGAVWCPPCNQVKATIFPRADFIERSAAFVPVYIDGDTPGAQKLGARFKVRGYPTMILFRPDGAEITRLPGEVDAQKYLKVLALGLEASRPVKMALDAALKDPKSVKPADWRLLASYSWETDDDQLVSEKERGALLRKLAAATPASEAEAQTTLLLKAAALGGKPSDKAMLARLNEVLADETLARAQADILVNFHREIVSALTAPKSAQRAKLLKAYDDRLGSLQTDSLLSRLDRLTALDARVQLARLDDPNAALSQALLQQVRDEAARADAEITTPEERQAAMPTAADALSHARLLDESDTLLKAQLPKSHSPYYFMLQLASNAKKRGDKEAALQWYERAYAESKGPATRLQWGTTYVNALLELAPQDEERIERAAASVIGEMKGQPDAFEQRNAARLARMDKALAKWNGAGVHTAALERVRTQIGEVCAQLPAQDEQRSACEALAGGKPAAKSPGTSA